jgi:hypothetical protein
VCTNICCAENQRHARSNSISRTRQFSLASEYRPWSRSCKIEIMINFSRRRPTTAGFKVWLRGSLCDGCKTLQQGHRRLCMSITPGAWLSRTPPHWWRLIRTLSRQLDSLPVLTPQTWFFFAKHSTIKYAHTYTHTLTPMNARVHTLPLWGRLHRRTDPAGLEIDEVTTGALMSTGTLSPTEEYSALMRHQNIKSGIWTLVGWGCNCPPNHPTIRWFSSRNMIYYYTSTRSMIWKTGAIRGLCGIRRKITRNTWCG